MRRSHLLLTCLSPVARIMATNGQKGGKNKREVNERQLPNVVFIYADDLGYGDFECYGVKNIQTPNMNRLASEGIRLTNAHAAAATSTPSRYSMLTGEYAWRRPGTNVAAGNVGMIIRPEDYTMADMFKNAGYAAATIGRWHLGLGGKADEQDWNAPLPAALGDLEFDYSCIIATTADRIPCVFIESGKVANYGPSAPIEVSYRKPFEGEPLGKDHPELLYNRKYSHGHDMAIANDIGHISYMKGGGKALWKDESIADSITSHAIDFIRDHEDEPFFTYFATNDIYIPRFPHERFHGKNPMELRGDAIVRFDWSVGQILETPDELDLSENTLIILSSDNGPVVDDRYQDRAEELLNGHSPAGPLRNDKYSAFEGGAWIPAIVRWPRQIGQPQVSGILVSQIDQLASLTSLVNARLSKGAAPDSFSRLGNWIGADSTDCPWVIEQASSRMLSVRTKSWKCTEPNDGPKVITWEPKVETGSSSIPQLYDMTRAYERENLTEKNPAELFELQTALRKVHSKAYRAL